MLWGAAQITPNSKLKQFSLPAAEKVGSWQLPAEPLSGLSSAEESYINWK